MTRHARCSVLRSFSLTSAAMSMPFTESPKTSPTRGPYDPRPQDALHEKGAQPTRSRTQGDQDKDDEKARKKAREDLVQSWMDRLQLISVITTFFAATNAQLLSVTTPMEPPGSASLQLSNAALSASLILESFSAVVSFLGAFVLVRYKLKEATKEEAEQSARENGASTWSRDPHLEQEYWGVLPARRTDKEPPVILLERAHTMSVVSAFAGFVTGALGTVAYTWAMQPLSVGVATSATLGLCLVLGMTVWFWPHPK